MRPGGRCSVRARSPQAQVVCVLGATALLCGCGFEKWVLGAEESGSGGLGGGAQLAPPKLGAAGAGGRMGEGPEATGGGPATEVPASLRVFAGQASTCALKAGVAHCWGRNSEGQLGVGHTEERLVPARVTGTAKFETLGVNHRHACGIDVEGTLHCWGDNTFHQVDASPEEMVVSPRVVELPWRVTGLGLGSGHTCVINALGELWCWGNNSEGQLGQGDNMNVVQQPAQVGDAKDWSMVTSYDGHTCGLRGEEGGGSLYCWGRNSDRQIGQGAAASIQYQLPQRLGDAVNWVSVETSQAATCALNAEGELWCTGTDVSGNLQRNDGDELPVLERLDQERWDGFSLDTFHACGLRQAALWCWGRNVSGQLGTGDVADKDTPVQVQREVPWETVSLGRFHSCATRREAEGDSLWCFGSNGSGMLGTGDKLDYFQPTLISF